MPWALEGLSLPGRFAGALCGSRPRQARSVSHLCKALRLNFLCWAKLPFSTRKLKIASTVEAGIYRAGETDMSMSQLAEELGHLKNHVTYPASKGQIVAACNGMHDLPNDDKDWVTKNLPEGNYRTPVEVVTALLGEA